MSKQNFATIDRWLLEREKERNNWGVTLESIGRFYTGVTARDAKSYDKPEEETYLIEFVDPVYCLDQQGVMWVRTKYACAKKSEWDRAAFLGITA